MMAKNSQDNFFENCWQVMANYPQLINNYWFNSFKKMDNSNFDQFNNISEILGKLLKDNDLISEYQRKWLENCWQIFDNISDSNANDNSELFTEDAKDNRFKDEAWQNNPFFNAVKQVYIMNLKLAIDFIEKNDELEQQEKGKLNFFIRYLFDSCSPTNYFLTNPTIIKETIDSKAENLLKGMRKLRSDFENQVDLFHMKSVDESKFKIGENVAATKGKVIFKNKILELIAYYPQHNESYAVPLLIVPPCIKKYYILDLQENNSMVKFLLDKNFVVLIVSWKNPDYRDAEVSFEDYIESLVEVVDFLTPHFKTAINFMGYCIGGLFTTVLINYLQQKKYNNIGAITLLTTLLDYNNSGDMSLFVSEQQIAKIEEKMQLHGFYDGADMSMMFNILRAREMIWGNFVDSYMRGKDPMAIDILFWNNDETRLPAKMASFYLRNCYLHNNFCQKNKIKIKDVYIDFSKINNDIFILATKDDHITPALGVFDNIKHLDNKKLDFVMSESGHVGGVVNPPWKNKYGYYYNKEQQHHEFSEWFANAKLKKESWWMLFEEWLAKRSGEKIKTTWHKKINLLAIDNAPGQYIYQK